MSKFTPTPLDDSVNIAQEHPLKELIVFLFKGILIFGVLYLLIGLTLEFFITRLSVEQENWIWSQTGLSTRFLKDHTPLTQEQAYVQKIFDKIPARVKPEGYDFSIIISDNDDPNAFAMPGGNIVITKGLLALLDTENGLVFVIGHEMGHFKNRDHLRGMGFSLSSLMLVTLLAGQNSNVVDALFSLTDLGNLAYSRKQEEQADTIGLQTLSAVYGHAGGATEFFEKLEKIEKTWQKKIPAIISTHPAGEKRIALLKNKIEQQGLKQRKLIPIVKFKSKNDPKTDQE